jgi:hypothetical protein
VLKSKDGVSKTEKRGLKTTELKLSRNESKGGEYF